MDITANTEAQLLSLLPPLPIMEDGRPKLFQGSSAQLSQLRSFKYAYNSSNNNDINGDDDDDEKETILCHIPHISMERRGGLWDNNDDNDEACSCGTTIGQLFVSTRRVFFVAAETTNGRSDAADMAMDAHCISLHAMTSSSSSSGKDDTRSSASISSDDGNDNESSGVMMYVYCQISSDSLVVQGGGGNMLEETNDIDLGVVPAVVGPMEVILSPIYKDNDVHGTRSTSCNTTHTTETERESNVNKCQLIFQALSRLATLNPMEEEGGDDHGTGSTGGGLMAMLAMMSGADISTSQNNDEMICRIDPHQLDTPPWGEQHGMELPQDQDGPSTSTSRRQQELDRLDDLLVVPPELEVHQGQFDDAESDDDLL